jgi:type I restriction enzyme, S subunit
MTKNNNPEVRFAGYTKDWEEKELSKVLTERNVLQKISEDAPILAFASGQGVIDRSERKSNNRDHLTLDQENKIYKLTELDDIVYNPSNLKYGAIDRNKHGRGVISPIYVTFTTEEKPSFLELIVKSEKFKLTALQFEQGTVVKRQSVKPEDLLSLKVNISPSIDEQEKIGRLFEQIDIIINFHELKYEKLKNVKKSMLEKMFPKPGSDLPEIRFKNFSGTWEKLMLRDESVDIVAGGDIDKSKISDTGKYPVIANALTSDGILGFYENDYRIKAPAVTVTGRGNIGDAKARKTNFTPVVRLLSIKTEHDVDFLENAINNHKVIIESTGIPQLTIPQLSNYEIYFPKQDEEEKVIGLFFNNLNNVISLHQVELKKLKNIKKAFFEKMTNTLSSQEA